MNNSSIAVSFPFFADSSMTASTLAAATVDGSDPCAARPGVRSGSESLFDYGMVNNFALTLGVYPLLWLLPVRTGIEGNGIFYPEKHSVQHFR